MHGVANTLMRGAVNIMHSSQYANMIQLWQTQGMVWPTQCTVRPTLQGNEELIQKHLKYILSLLYLLIPLLYWMIVSKFPRSVSIKVAMLAFLDPSKGLKYYLQLSTKQK